ncbi:MAG: permease prefix domain 1-containing protein [Acidobacteriota bacterium]
MKTNQTLEEHIKEWRVYMQKRPALRTVDIEELEDHLQSQARALTESGLDEDEAFLVAVKRLGDIDSLTREFGSEYSERLWKQLVLSKEQGETSPIVYWDALLAVGMAVAASLAIKLPELFGVRIDESEAGTLFYARNSSLFVLPFLAVYFAWKRKLVRVDYFWLAVPFVTGAVIVNILPFREGSHTEILAALHLPIALWLAVGFAYSSARWRSHEQRMNYVRFSGEWLIYYILIGLGGGVLMGFTMFIFGAIGFDAEDILNSWMLPCGVVGAVIISAWLVEAKKSIIENMAPVLTRLFTPLFTALLVIFLMIMIWTDSSINVKREVLIGFDLLLVLVLGLLLYSISARDPEAPPGIFDALQLLLVVCALLVDLLALWAIGSRISEFGFSPNKVAALGENLVLLVNLGWSAVLYSRFLMKRCAFAPLERWQTAYSPVYFIWAWAVVLLFPIIFNYQ